MAVQKSRKSRSKRDTRRTHDVLPFKALTQDSMTGETHLRHHVSPTGYYKDRKIIASNEDE